MAFMMPVMKNNYDIYKDTRSRSRKTSECSNASSGGGVGGAASAPASQQQQHQQRRRKVSECKSESFATSPSPSHGQFGGGQRSHSSRGFTRNASRCSQGGSSLQMSQLQLQMMSPTRSSPPSRTQTASALERQAAMQAAAQSAAAAAAQQQQQQQQQQQSNNDYTKFHLRLVDKLRKSFRKDNGKRS
ncbi:negative elongation factor A [Drosophila nasuta]|uniref:negative elongation factor A n=1 Tax=Drosophila nasuta TaxID=42062 RepID=UPI00295F3580|nr:negative elongation factor A [Drosophila nasuta]